jgi:hypothetical protein
MYIVTLKGYAQAARQSDGMVPFMVHLFAAKHNQEQQ